MGIVIRRTVALWPTLVSVDQVSVTTSRPASPFGELDAIFNQFPLLTLIHILPALLFIGLGPLQFSRGIRRRHPNWHRWSGRIFLVASSLIGITALWMSFVVPPIGGFSQAAATTLFSLFFLVALYQGFRSIRQGNVVGHREWMIRVYAIGLAVATIRLVNALLFAARLWTGLVLADFFGTGFWIGFVMHLIGAEVWISYTRSSPERPNSLPDLPNVSTVVSLK
ncbi:DUF2306 domain-containing protein [Spirosoma gilvum]